MKCSKFSSLINLMNRHWSVLLDHIALQLDMEGMKGREDGKRGKEGTIIRGRRLIEGRLLFQEIRYMRLAWAPLGGILMLRSQQIISIKQTIPAIIFLYIPLPSNRALELVCNSHIFPEKIESWKAWPILNVFWHFFKLPPCWTHVTQRHSPDYVLKCGISKRKSFLFLLIA